MDLMDRSIQWDVDRTGLQDLFATTWIGHPILKTDYFVWQFSHAPRGKAIGYCASSKKVGDFITGAYIVLPSIVLVDGEKLLFSTSLYTMTHPDYYMKGIFGRLANLTFSECLSKNIVGTIGIPNKKSLPGFKKNLGFKVLGQFQVLARFASPLYSAKNPVAVKELSDSDVSGMEFNLDQAKAEAGFVMNERSKEFMLWRFFHCPGVKYHVLAAFDRHDSIKGILVLRFTMKRRVPVSVIVDFIVDHSSADAEVIADALMLRAYRLAWRYFSPLLIVLVNPYSYEASLFGKHGFRQMPRGFLPHDSNFILKLHADIPEGPASKLHRFENWHFSFADYDIF